VLLPCDTASPFSAAPDSRKDQLRATIAKRGTMRNLHEVSCACCSGLTAAFDRRYFVRAIGVGAATLPFVPYFALAAEGNYEAMVLACIDPRMQEPVHRYTVEQNLTGKFSQFVIAGAAIGVVAPAFKDWHKAFWDNLATTIQLHRIKKVIAIDHRDCSCEDCLWGSQHCNPTSGNANAPSGPRGVPQASQRAAQLGVETGLMALDGKMEMFS
jgi:carbonic anhydrase